MIRIVKTFANKPKLHNSAWFLVSCVADVMITVSLVLTLSKRKTGFSGTDLVIDKIVRSAYYGFSRTLDLKLTRFYSVHPNWHDNVQAIPAVVAN